MINPKVKILAFLCELCEPVSVEFLAELSGEDVAIVQETLSEYEQYVVQTAAGYEIQENFRATLFQGIEQSGLTLQVINGLIADSLTQGVFGDE